MTRSQKSKSIDKANINGGRWALAQLTQTMNTRLDRHETLSNRLSESLLSCIANAVWSSGDKLPPETDIAKVVELSVGTVRKALSRLAEEGVLLRRHGHGTFVSGGDKRQSMELLHFRFIEPEGSRLMPVYAEVISRITCREHGPWNAFLGAEDSIIRIRRRIEVGALCNCISDFYVDANKFADIKCISIQDLSKVVIRDVLAHEFNCPTFKIDINAYSCEFPRDIRRLIAKCNDLNFGMVLEAYSYTHFVQPLSFQNVFIPANAPKLDLPSPSLIR